MTEPANSFQPGALIRRGRRIKRLDQRELAELSGVPLATLARIESGATTNPRLHTLAAVFAALDCRLAVLHSGDHELPAHPWEDELDFGERHYPAHVELVRVNRPYQWDVVDWHGWYRDWAWQPGAAIPLYTFFRARTSYHQPPLDPRTGEPITPPPDDDSPLG